MSARVLFDAPGPIMRRRVFIGSVVAALAIAGGMVWVVRELAAKGQFAATKWGPFVHEPRMIPFLVLGLRNTMAATLIALGPALVLGIALAVGRLLPYRWLRAGAAIFVEFFRTPVLLLMLFFFLAFPILFDVDLPTFWAVVLSLTLFNGAVIGEIGAPAPRRYPRGRAKLLQPSACDGCRRCGSSCCRQALGHASRIGEPVVVLLKDTSLGL